MKIPSKLKVGGHKIKIILKNLPDAYGQYEFEEGTITIHKDSPQSIKESTLIHEILHVINATIGANQIGHSLLESLSEQLYQVLSDNKLLKE